MRFKFFLLLSMLLPLAVASRAQEATSNPASELSVDIKIGTGLDGHEPTGVADVFPADVTQLVGWTRVKGAESPIIVKHVWIHEGKEKVEIELPVKSTSFRTWSRKAVMGLKGKWRLEVRGPDESVLASKEFEVGNPGPEGQR